MILREEVEVNLTLPLEVNLPLSSEKDFVQVVMLVRMGTVNFFHLSMSSSTATQLKVYFQAMDMKLWLCDYLNFGCSTNVHLIASLKPLATGFHPSRKKLSLMPLKNTGILCPLLTAFFNLFCYAGICKLSLHLC